MSLYEDTRDALLTGPSEIVWTNSRGARIDAETAALDVFIEMNDTKSEVVSHTLTLIRDAAKGEDVQLRAKMLVDLIAHLYAKMHSQAPELTDADMERISEERRSEWKGAL